MMAKYKIIDDRTVLDQESNSFIPVSDNGNVDAITYRDWLMKGGIPDAASIRSKPGKTLEQQLSEVEDGKVVIKQDSHNLVVGKSFDEITIHPQVIFRFADSLDVYTPSASLSSVVEPKQRYSFYSQILPATNLIQFGFNAALDIGIYELQSLGIRDRSCGIMSLEVNGVDQGWRIDWYSSRPLLNQLDMSTHNAEVKTNVVITSKGVNRFVFKVASKNTASSGFAVLLTRFALKKIN